MTRCRLCEDRVHLLRRLREVQTRLLNVDFRRETWLQGANTPSIAIGSARSVIGRVIELLEDR